jgi:hypothetical protein
LLEKSCPIGSTLQDCNIHNNAFENIPGLKHQYRLLDHKLYICKNAINSLKKSDLQAIFNRQNPSSGSGIPLIDVSIDEQKT